MEDIKLKYEKIIVITMVVLVIGIICIVGMIYGINKNNIIENKEEDEDEISNLEESGEEYNIEHLNNFDFEVINLDGNTTSKIKDINQFLLDMKEYMYINGLVQISKVECISVNEVDNKLLIEFKLNDPKNTILSASINLKDNTYTFSDNYQI